MVTSQTKARKSRYLASETVFFPQIKKLITYQGKKWQKIHL